MIETAILDRLCRGGADDHLAELTEIMKTAKMPPAVREYINNHIHTTYSFSPYSPAAAVFAARAEGLSTAGIVDHDSIGGAKEFLRAGEIVGMPVTIGFECRVSMEGTPFADIRTNNPDQKGCSYVVVHGVPHDRIDEVQSFFAPLRAYRNERNKKMVAKINDIMAPYGISLDFDRDVLPLSMYHDGGSVTERHLMMALARAITAKAGKGKPVVVLLKKCGVSLSNKQEEMLTDTSYPFYEYDLLGILKSGFISSVYVEATDECAKLSDVLDFANKIGAIFCYSYLGDAGESPTGDKKAQKFEDEYLDQLFEYLAGAGVGAITYMPTRNTKEQLDRLRGLCARYNMFQISGEDVNSPRQSFICKAMENPEFGNLIDSTWALIKHERGEKLIELRKGNK